MLYDADGWINIPVTPLAGVWIEIRYAHTTVGGSSSSLPLRECGLKFCHRPYVANYTCVTPLAGVWIEIIFRFLYSSMSVVTPLAGVWIEICQ